MKPTLYIMCGLPGSGKSYHAHKIENAQIVSTDDIREELYGDAAIQGKVYEVWDIALARIENILLQKRAAILDATNLRRKNRKKIIDKFNKIATIVCVCVITPKAQCLINNENRDRHVPVYVIERMADTFESPIMEEGFDNIIIIEWED